MVTYLHTSRSSANVGLLAPHGDICGFIFYKSAGPASAPHPLYAQLSPNLKGDHGPGKCCALKNWAGYFHAEASTFPLFSYQTQSWGWEAGQEGWTGGEFGLRKGESKVWDAEDDGSSLLSVYQCGGGVMSCH